MASDELRELYSVRVHATTAAHSPRLLYNVTIPLPLSPYLSSSLSPSLYLSPYTVLQHLPRGTWAVFSAYVPEHREVGRADADGGNSLNSATLRRCTGCLRLRGVPSPRPKSGDGLGEDGVSTRGTADSSSVQRFPFLSMTTRQRLHLSFPLSISLSLVRSSSRLSC